jgi:hypothetical protein
MRAWWLPWPIELDGRPARGCTYVRREPKLTVSNRYRMRTRIRLFLACAAGQLQHISALFPDSHISALFVYFKLAAFILNCFSLLDSHISALFLSQHCWRRSHSNA